MILYYRKRVLHSTAFNLSTLHKGFVPASLFIFIHIITVDLKMRLLCNIMNTDLDTAAPCWCEKLFFDADPKFSGNIHLSSIKMSTHCTILPPAIVEKFPIVHMQDARFVRDPLSVFALRTLLPLPGVERFPG